MSDKPRWSPAFIRTLLSIAAIPSGFFLGAILIVPMIGAPHAFPGLLMHASDEVRNDAALLCVFGTPIAFLLAIWWKPLKALFK